MVLLTACNMKKKHIEITVLLKQLNVQDTLDPSFFRLSQEYIYLENLTTRLVELNKNGQYTNLLTDKITIKNDRKDYYFKIKKAYFSDGSLITPRDVINSFKRLILYGSPHSNPKEFIRGAQDLNEINQNIEGLKVVETDTIFIGLNYPMKELFYYLQLADYGILHSSQYSKNELKLRDWEKITSGPYRINLKGNAVTFVVNTKSISYRQDIPHSITPLEKKGEELVKSVREGEVHFGFFSFSDFKNHRDALLRIKEVNVFGENTDAISYIVLNINSKKFKSQKTRQWFLKKILMNFEVNKKQQSYMKKAYQYFLPGAKGYVPVENIFHILQGVKIVDTPEELKLGVKIKTIETMKNYLTENTEEVLSSSLGIPVQLDFSVKRKNYKSFLLEREFDAFVIAAGMSYKVVGETLNLAYTSKTPTMLDLSGKIHKNLREYQKTDNPAEEQVFIEKILKQMVVDAECIPLYYIASPFFYNKKILNIDDVNIDEIPQFWKMYVQ